MSHSRRRFVWEIDWNLLRTFTVIVQEKGLTAAGDRLLLKQPTISNALRRLESHMGCRLVDRSSSRFSVTPAGERLYGECIRLFDIVSALPDLMEGHPEAVAGHIEMAFTSHVECPFLDRFLTDFHNEFQRIAFSTSVSSSQHAVEAVLNDKACLGICLAQEKHPDLAYRVLYREHFGFFCAPGHPLFGRRDVTLADLTTLDYATFKTDDLVGALAPVAQLRQRAGFSGQVLGAFTNLEEVKRLIKAGICFGPLPIHAVAAETEAGQLWQLPPHDDPPPVDVYVVFKPDARLSKAENVFLDRLLAAIDAVPLRERTYPEHLAATSG